MGGIIIKKILSIFLILSTIMALISCDNQTKTIDKDKVDVHHLGDTITIDGFEITCTNAKFTNSIDTKIYDSKYLIVETNVKNISEKSRIAFKSIFNPSTDLYIDAQYKDSEFTISDFMDDDFNIIDVNIEPQESINRVIILLIPEKIIYEGDDNLYIIFYLGENRQIFLIDNIELE